MLRIVLFSLMVYVLWKVIRVVVKVGRSGKMRREERSSEQNIPSFPNVADAQFEDITSKDSSSPKSPEQS